MLAHPFGHNIASSGHGLLDRFHTFFCVNIALGRFFYILDFVVKYGLGQGLQALFPSDTGFCFALWFEGEIDVFQISQGCCAVESSLQFIG